MSCFFYKFMFVISVLSDLGQAKEAPEYRNVRFGPRQDESIERVMLPNLSFKKCLKQCALRSSCEVMGYFRAALLCELHFIRDFWDTLACNENGPRVMVYVQRSDILLKEAETCKYCGNSTSQTCGHCVTNECPPYAKVPNGKILGNLHCDGTKRLLKCDNGYAPKDRTYVQSVCKDRQWTKITQCVPGDNDGFLLDFYNTRHSVLRMDDNTQISYSNFRANEPSNGNEPKIAAMGTDNWLWHDVPEQDRFQTVCESDI